MSHRIRQGFTVAGLLLLLIVASSEVLLPSLPRQRVGFQLEPTAPAAEPEPAKPVEAASPPPAGASVQLYDVSVLDLRRAKAPAPAAPKPTPRKPRVEKAPDPPAPKDETAAAKPKAATQPPEAKPAAPLPPEQAKPSAPPTRPGELPGLLVEFSALGLERYARLTERLGGAFFAYMGTESGNPLGPRLSLAEGRLVALGETGDLAADRPYLVSDPGVADRLRGADLPPAASAGSVVMMWPRWLDRAMWSTVDLALSDWGTRSENVARVEASARETDGAVEFRIEGFVLRDNGRRIALAEPRAVRVGR